MKFSIIIPCYKVEKYLSECVDSVLNQTFTDFELILVDDGSPDRVPGMCDEYVKKDARVRVIHQKNAGIACARNAGIAVAKGEYVVCIDSDDYLIDTSSLCKIASKTKKCPEIVMFGYKKYFECDGSWGADVCANIGDCKSVGSIVKTTLLNGSYIATAWTKAVRRDLLVENNIVFRPGMVSGEDVDWYLNVLCYTCKIECLPFVCLAYRQRSDSISHSLKVQSLDDFIWILETWPRRIEDMVIDEELKAAMYNAMAYYLANTFVLFSRYSNYTVKPYKYRLKRMHNLFDYAVTSRALTIKKFYKLLGFSATIRLLRFIDKLKKH